MLIYPKSLYNSDPYEHMKLLAYLSYFEEPVMNLFVIHSLRQSLIQPVTPSLSVSIRCGRNFFSTTAFLFVYLSPDLLNTLLLLTVFFCIFFFFFKGSYKKSKRGSGKGLATKKITFFEALN